jgi:hypothetical protein
VPKSCWFAHKRKLKLVQGSKTGKGKAKCGASILQNGRRSSICTELDHFIASNSFCIRKTTQFIGLLKLRMSATFAGAVLLSPVLVVALLVWIVAHFVIKLW